MKLLLKQYLSSLKERDELDVVLPDIISEVGFTVVSRPKRGTTQYGVDVAAIGPHPKTGEQALFLLSIKSGDLTRDEWASGNQALRPSLEEIVEVYIPKRVPKRYKDLPVVIALCFGGDIHEAVRPQVDGFIDKNTVSGRLEFEEWNGDYLANLIATGLLRENIFERARQTSFRKAVALVDEPDVCVQHFLALLDQLVETTPPNLSARLQVARQIYLATWTVFVWCRDAKNLESAYRCSVLAALRIWDLSHAHFSGKSTASKALGDVTNKMVQLNRIIATTFIEEHVEPFSHVEDGMGVSVPSGESVDINLKLFETLGRVAIHGLWLMRMKERIPDAADADQVAIVDAELQKCLELLCNLINHNPAYYTPLRDDHAIEITLAGLFFMQCGAYDFMHKWVEQTTLSSIFSYRVGGKYPCIFREYSDLATHPRLAEGYDEEATVGSVLYPSLGVWLAIFGDADTFGRLAEFQADDMSHSTWQLWLPDEITDEHLYRNTKIHGACFSDLKMASGGEAFLEQITKEIVASTAFNELSAIKFDAWPLVLMACQTYRLPVPPHFWALQRGVPQDSTDAN